jgi:hypothetical protein
MRRPDRRHVRQLAEIEISRPAPRRVLD